MNDIQTDAWDGKKIRAAIIEDELPAARLLQGMLAELRPQWDILLLPGTVEDAVQWFAMATTVLLLALILSVRHLRGGPRRTTTREAS